MKIYLNSKDFDDDELFKSRFRRKIFSFDHTETMYLRVNSIKYLKCNTCFRGDDENIKFLVDVGDIVFMFENTVYE